MPSSRLTAIGAAGLLVVGGLAVSVPAQAAPPPTPPAVAGVTAAPVPPPGPGKGDSDGDGIADDLAAALVSRRPADRVGVIVQGATPARARAAAPSLRTGHVFPSITGFSGTVTAGQVRALSRIPGVTRVELDGVSRALDASGDLDYGVAAARSAGAATDGTLDGDGVGICVIDTGIDPNHEQLVGRVVGWRDWVNGRTTPYDDHGHGTHVSSIAAGSGAGSPQFGGVARAALLIGAKVLNSSGSGADADVVAAIEWCAARADVQVISMSLGSPASDGSDAGSQAVDAAVAEGKVVVVAAGNSGDAPGTISAPGVATGAITVGAGSDPSSLAGASDTDTSLYLAGFSSRGPTANPAAPLKPDVVAPGLSVVAAKAGTTNGYVAYSGTSMATPFVAGIVALGLEAAPSATPAQVKSALQASARDAGAAGPDNEWGHGLVDARSFVAALGAAPAGTAPWPAHTLVQGSVASGTTRDYPVTVTASGSPLGVTLRTANGASTCVLPLGGQCLYGYEWAPDLDAYLVSPSGTVVAMSRCMLESTNGNCAAPGRFETVGVAAAAAGTWQLRVESFSGSGSFVADVFGAIGSAPPPDPPNAPTGVGATATSSSSVTVSWTDASTDETGFEVQRCTGSGCTSFAAAGSTGAGVTSFVDGSLAASTTYGYRVRAVNGNGPSAWTDAVYATTPAPPAPPNAPMGVGATATSSSSVTVSWTDASTDETGFEVQRCTGSGCTSFVAAGSTGAGVTTFVDGSLAASTTYGYRVRAVNGNGPSAWSSTAYATTQAAPTAPSAPTGLTATAVSATRVDLRWTDTSSTETGFRLERCSGAKCVNFAVVATLGANVTTYSNTGLSAATSYRYRVQAFNASGFSAYSSIVTVKTLRR